VFKGSTYNNLGNAYSGLKDYQKALEIYATTIAIDSTLDYVYYNLGAVYVKLRKYLDAIEDFDSAIKINPQIA
jgi:tetratricopeptide (TPR) repeat protein